MSFEHLGSIVDLALLEVELGEGGHSSFTFIINSEGFVTASFSSADVLLPLVQCEPFVHNWENVGWGPGSDVNIGSVVQVRDLPGFLELDGLFEFLHGLLEALLVQK